MKPQKRLDERPFQGFPKAWLACMCQALICRPTAAQRGTILVTQASFRASHGTLALTGALLYQLGGFLSCSLPFSWGKHGI